MNDDPNNDRDTIDMLLEALDGINEPRRLRVTHTVGELSVTIEASNFEAAEVDNETDQNEQ